MTEPNPFQAVSALGFEFTPRPAIRSHTEATAYLDMRRAELVAALGMYQHVIDSRLSAGDITEAHKLLAEMSPLRAQLASIQSLEVAR